MATDVQVLEKILDEVIQLSPEYRLRLIQKVTESLLPPVAERSQLLEFGKYKGVHMSSLKDFSVAEWQPTGIDPHDA